MVNWKPAFMASLDYVHMPAPEVIISLKEIGYEGIEWTTAHFDPDKPIHELKEIVDQTREAEMEVSRIMAHEDLVLLDDRKRKELIDRTVRVIEAAGECSVRTVGTITGPEMFNPHAVQIGRDISEEAAWIQVFEAFEEFGKAAKKAGVIISVEGVVAALANNFYTTSYFMDRLDSSVFRVNFDPSHGLLHGDYDVGWIVRQWGDTIEHVHLKDAVGIPEEGKFIFPQLGEGILDWKAFFAALDDIGYSGYCSIEYESFAYYRQILKNDPELAAKQSYQALQVLLSSYSG